MLIQSFVLDVLLLYISCYEVDIFFLVVLPLLCFAQIDYAIHGNVDELRAYKKVYLIFDDNRKDSADLQNGSFEFTGRIDKAKRVSLGVYDTANFNPAAPQTLRSFREFYISTPKISINGKNLNKAKVDADQLNSVFSTYWDETDRLRIPALQRSREYIKKMANGSLTDEEALKHQADFDEYMQMIAAFDLDFLEKNELTLFSVDLIERHLSQYNVPRLKEIFETIPAHKMDAQRASKIVADINRFEQLAVGATAPNFSLSDTAGRVVSLESLCGKTILLDFWASWCVPCREENPVYREVYEKYKGKGFHIVAVSLNKEQEKAAWLQAIRDDDISEWTHLSDLQGFKSPIYRLYEVGGLPQNYLIDANGLIIGHNLKGVELADALEEIYHQIVTLRCHHRTAGDPYGLWGVSRVHSADA